MVFFRPIHPHVSGISTQGWLIPSHTHPPLPYAGLPAVLISPTSRSFFSLKHWWWIQKQGSAELLEITTCLAVVALFSNSSQHEVHRGCSSAVGRPCVYTAMIKRLITLEQWAALSDEREMYTTYGWLNLLWCECVCLGCILACRHLSSCVYKFTATLQNDVFLLVLLALHYSYTAV